ncbi:MULTISPECIES: thioredoxin [Larsenimonas]|uniref:Thioredoxin n=1 Tax=Larsenimonas suaedae TaxID=1851019 RepID=A0ABU1GSA8_9GAMM|nr:MULTISPECIES: thioredoxin [Larsenimonas]MCM2972303.1 thioredoxin [Larsenimonas suaedae]MCM5704133.1 thioredoxin [Larsenimonas salina]MDR5894901.1 thioredoxin [Larsenimonas suaedae]
MSERVAQWDEASLERELTAHSGAVLIDFWAPWCGPCKQLAPVLDDIATELEGRVRVAKIDIDQYPDIAARFNVRGIPTLILFLDGNVEATKVGALPKAQILEFIEEELK